MRNCDSCGVELTLMLPELHRRNDDRKQYEGGLVITIEGGYNMLIDEYVEPFVLCGNCGRTFIAQNVFMITPETEFLTKEEIDAVG